MRYLLRQIPRLLTVGTPFIIFGIIYFMLGLWPNYMFNDIDVRGVYGLEKQLFGITTATGMVTPCEYFCINHHAVMDIFSGLFYLLWIPSPVIYALILQLTGHSKVAIHLSSAFLIANLIGFIGYYIYPAAPPWYVMQHGFEPILGTPGNVAGFQNFDELTGIPIFANIYNKNANVFAAIPSLHAAYNVVAFLYAIKVPTHRWWQGFIGIVAVGIWFSAVYSGHHYIIDVLLGILTAVAGVWVFEKLLMRISPVARLYDKVIGYLEKVKY